jgi:hypothetical protein
MGANRWPWKCWRCGTMKPLIALLLLSLPAAAASLTPREDETGCLIMAGEWSTSPLLDDWVEDIESYGVYGEYGGVVVVTAFPENLGISIDVYGPDNSYAGSVEFSFNSDGTSSEDPLVGWVMDSRYEVTAIYDASTQSWSGMYRIYEDRLALPESGGNFAILAGVMVVLVGCGFCKEQN